MYSGRLKAFTSLSNWYSEFRLYRRDQDGRIVKEHDHLMDGMRYLIASGLGAMQRIPQKPKTQYVYTFPGQNNTQWMA